MSNNNNNSDKNKKGSTEYKKKGNYKGKGRSYDRDDAKSSNDSRNKNRYRDGSDKALGDYVGTNNDPQWYMKNPRLIADAAKVPFGYQLGSKLNIGDLGLDNNYWSSEDYRLPGIMALDMISIPGVATDADDGVNLAATGLFQYIRKNLSTYSQYAAADVMMYVLAVQEIYAQYANIQRCFGIANTYSATNLYYPKRLLKAGYDFSNAAFNTLINGMNDYRAQFNNLIYKASSIYLPTDFSMTKRMAWLYSNYWIDSASYKGQLYIHRMAYTHIIDETSSEQGTMLVTIPMGGTMQLMLNGFSQSIERIRNSDSMLKIAADMRRAFEGHQVWRLAYQDENYMVLPAYSPEVLSQIHNMSITSPISDNISTGDLASWNVTQDVDKNIVLCKPRWTDVDDPAMRYDFVNCDSTKMLDFNHDAVTTEELVEATRNQVQVTGWITEEGGYVRNYLTSSGADVCLSARIIQMTENDANVEYSYNGVWIGSDATSDPAYAATPVMNMAMYAMFDWAPIMYLCYPRVNSFAYVVPFASLNNYSKISSDNLAQLNRNVLCSMWSIPELGEYNPT